MISHVVDLAGGLARLDSWSMEAGVFADVYFPCIFLSQPQFDRTEWAPAPLTAEWKRRLQPATGNITTKRTVTSDFAVGPLSGLFEDLMLFERLREYVTTNDVAPNDDIFRWRQLHKSNCDARLVILHLDNVGFSSTAANPYQTPPSTYIAAIY